MEQRHDVAGATLHATRLGRRLRSHRPVGDNSLRRTPGGSLRRAFAFQQKNRGTDVCHCARVRRPTFKSPTMKLESNLAQERPTFVTHLECSLTGERYEADRLQGLSKVGRPLLVRYDLAGVGNALNRAM